MLRYDLNTKYGEITIAQTNAAGTQTYKNQIVWGNCLAVFVYLYTDEKGVKMVQLCDFWADTQHTKNIIKNNGGKLYPSYIEVKGIKLNMYYKESETLLKIYTKAGYKVTAYYNEPKQGKK